MATQVALFFRFFFAGFLFLELDAVEDSLSWSVEPGVEGLCLCFEAAAVVDERIGFDEVEDPTFGAASDEVVEARDSGSDSDEGFSSF